MSIARFYKRQAEPVTIYEKPTSEEETRFLQQLMNAGVVSPDEVGTLLKAAYSPGTPSVLHVESFKETLRVLTFSNPHLKTRL